MGSYFAAIAFGQYFPGLGATPPAPGPADEVTTAVAYFARVLTGEDAGVARVQTGATATFARAKTAGAAAFARAQTGQRATFRRSVTTADTER